MPEFEKVVTQHEEAYARMVYGATDGIRTLYCLYFRIMKYNSSINMVSHGEDFLFLSNDHISPVFYSTFARADCFDIKKLAIFCTINSCLRASPGNSCTSSSCRIARGSLRLE